MTQIHSLKFLPEQSLINSIASYSDEFMAKDFNYFNVVEKLKATILNNNFMTEQDNWNWAKTRGSDYFHNPKLFALAPLTYVCAFLSEVFKNFDVEQINTLCPANVLQQALLRLKSFMQ